jgi:NADH:ubiquinone oxidoreductase subunit K
MINPNETSFKNARSGIVLFSLSLLLAAFWTATIFINPYDNKFVGIFFEILWLPMLAGFLLVPVLALIFWYHEKFNKRSLNMLTLIIVGILLTILNFR